ncbi:alpha/beta fold hydrolase [Massilia sp. ST3]|uniref:thioesterase II family protein n=1 Tax=Massilia sp. ST3 TaxID=2824903 RepID=UPI001B83B909|nr:thioesterase [Massilia sp. ST3]
MRLYCFAYAGGNASFFAPWREILAPEIEVCAIRLPGRGARMTEPLISCFDDLVAQLATIISNENAEKFAFFGHSLGALLSFEVARKMKQNASRGPLHLFSSGCSAPQRRASLPPFDKLSDDELLETLRSYKGDAGGAARQSGVNGYAVPDDTFGLQPGQRL